MSAPKPPIPQPRDPADLSAAAGSAAASALLASRQPPKYVPTLTQVVPLDPNSPASAASKSVKPTKEISSQTTFPSAEEPASKFTAVQSRELAHRLQRQLITHAQQHVDALLQQRLREAVSEVVLTHTHEMLQSLQPAIEEMINKVVQDAVAQALGEVLAKKNPR